MPMRRTLRGTTGEARAFRYGPCLELRSFIRSATDPQSIEHLNVMTRTTDAFRIAEEDLRLRGPGEMPGTRQRGPPELRIADLARDAAQAASRGAAESV